MKKTLITAMLLACASLASQGDTSLVADWNGFSSLTSGTYTLTLDSLGTAANKSAVDSDGILTVNGSGGLAASYRPTVDLSAAKLSLSKGVTFSLLIRGNLSNGANILATSGSTTTFQFAAGVGADIYEYTNGPVAEALNGDGAFSFNGGIAYGGNDDSVNTNITTALNSTSFSVLTITAVDTTVEDVETTVFTMYLNGAKVGVGATTNDIADETISGLALGGWNGSSSGGASSYDLARLSIYNGAISEEEIASFTQTFRSTAAIPEPATATLSLLALAGLAARRRRK